MRKLFLVVLALVSVLTTSFAQIESPVTWDTSVKELGNGEYELTLESILEEGYYIYGMGVYEGGPTGTTFTFTKSDAIELIGDP